jgi:hypothetical protein
MTLRFELFEQGQVLNILDKNVTDEYFSESGGKDSGLYLLDSLKCWRDNGWRIGQSQVIRLHGCWRKLFPPTNLNSYYIYAFGAIEPRHHEDVKATCYLLNGVYVGVALPNTAKNQVIWAAEGDPEKDADSKRFSWGGHCVYITAYDAEGLTCVTWGSKKRMTWQFFDTYTFDCFGIIDARDKWLGDASPVDIEKLDKYLDDITA